MYCLVNGLKTDVPVQPNGMVNSDTIRRIARLRDNRSLILQQPDGKNLVVNPGQSVRVRPLDAFVDAPLHTRG